MRHHARLDVTSEPGKGSTFSVVFPEARRLPGREAAIAATQGA
jgi:signal transduction histidine kinase